MEEGKGILKQIESQEDYSTLTYENLKKQIEDVWNDIGLEHNKRVNTPREDEEIVRKMLEHSLPNGLYEIKGVHGVLWTGVGGYIDYLIIKRRSEAKPKPLKFYM